MKRIFHITTQIEWDQAIKNGFYSSPSLKTEGFIHFSLTHQVLFVAGERFKGKKNLVLLEVDESLVGPKVIYEGEAEEKFPHVYGPLNLNAVLKVHKFEEGPQGFVLPQIGPLVC